MKMSPSCDVVAEMRQHRLQRHRDRAQMARQRQPLRHQPALRVADRGAVVHDVLQHAGIGGAVDRQHHLVADRRDRIAEQFFGDRIGHAACGSVVTRDPTTDAVSWQPVLHYGTVRIMTCLAAIAAGPAASRACCCGGCDATPDLDCKLTMIAQMPLEVQDRLLVVPAGINGNWVHLVVDSGAERTTISAATADRLGLPHDARYKVQSLGIGGATTTHGRDRRPVRAGRRAFPDRTDGRRHASSCKTSVA